MRILVVEDDDVISGLLQQGLRDAGYTVTAVNNGDEALCLLDEVPFHLIVLDIMLPGCDGISLCGALRKNSVSTPVLMLTARDTVDDRVRGLDSGADDYLVKPFDFKELLARIRALMRRERTKKGNVVQVADLCIDTVKRRATRAGVDLDLSYREFELLLALASHEQQVFTRQMLLDTVWMNEAPVSNIVDVFIKSLRRKIDVGFTPPLIHTVWSVGYTMRIPLSEPLK